ncbi:hypothetical protein CWR48_00575 [Oceanobacillus arenosus]|uniref:Uncharacterized protein n=1 Tax=Oceanobacillus arenosus TaxID=1229153 RepID=A0A3D8Q488_9BACI|nr:hypothetical protein CWR48_00575 [Oceanobacillus arenosus]
MSFSESMLTYRTEVREVSLVAGRWSWTWLFSVIKLSTAFKFYNFLDVNKEATTHIGVQLL